MAILRKIASLFGRRPAQRQTTGDCACPEILPEQDPAFTSAITALGAKLLSKDRRGANGAFEAFSREFPTAPGSGWQVRRFFGLARQSSLGVESYAESITRRYGRCPNVLERALDGLFRLAKSDGVVTGEEMAILERVGDRFGLSPLGFDHVKARHLGQVEDPYGLLKVEPSATNEAVHAAWKIAAVALHPDRLAGRGASADEVAHAEAAAMSLNAAYEAVMRERTATQREAA